MSRWSLEPVNESTERKKSLKIFLKNSRFWRDTRLNRKNESLAIFETIVHYNLTGFNAQKGTPCMKRFIAFLMLCMLCFALSACGVDAPNAPEKGNLETSTSKIDPPPQGGGGG
jgi:hypothetical protein